MKTFHLLISGKVQGVFYRASARKEAIKNKISGSIKNIHGGHVEAVITGDATAINIFINWCKSGPAGALVDEVIVTQIDFVNFDQFEILH